MVPVRPGLIRLLSIFVSVGLARGARGVCVRVPSLTLSAVGRFTSPHVSEDTQTCDVLRSFWAGLRCELHVFQQFTY